MAPTNLARNQSPAPFASALSPARTVTSKLLRRVAALSLAGALAALGGCADDGASPTPRSSFSGADASTPPTGSGGGAGSTVAPPTDPANPASPPPATSLSCSDLSLPANLPQANGRFFHTAGPSAQTPPAQSGGDPTGEWALTGITVYLPEISALLINAEASTVSGSGWVSVRDGVLRMALDSSISLFVGTSPFITLPLKARGVLRYTIAGNTMTLDPVCLEGAEDTDTQGMMLTIGAQSPFTINGDTGTVQLTFMLDAQEVKILASIQRIS